MVEILHLGAHHHPMRGGIHARPDIDDLSPKKPTWVSLDPNLHILPQAQRGEIHLRHVRQHPEGGDIGQRVRPREATRLYQKPRSGVARATTRPDRGLRTTTTESTLRWAMMLSISASVLPRIRTALRAARSAPSAAW